MLSTPTVNKMLSNAACDTPLRPPQRLITPEAEALTDTATHTAAPSSETQRADTNPQDDGT